MKLDITEGSQVGLWVFAQLHLPTLSSLRNGAGGSARPGEAPQGVGSVRAGSGAGKELWQPLQCVVVSGAGLSTLSQGHLGKLLRSPGAQSPSPDVDAPNWRDIWGPQACGPTFQSGTKLKTQLSEGTRPGDLPGGGRIVSPALRIFL